MIVIIVLMVVLLLLFAGSILMYLMALKKFKELKEQGDRCCTEIHTLVEFGTKDLQVKTLECRIIVSKQSVALMNEMSMQEYLISRLCNEELIDFLHENIDLIHFRQSENLYADEEIFDVKLSIVKPN